MCLSCASQSRQNGTTGTRNIPATLPATSTPKDSYENYAATTAAATEMKTQRSYKPNNCLTINHMSQHTLESTPKLGQHTKA